MTQPYKKCPRCDTPAEPQALQCRNCGHTYRMQFVAPSLNQTQFINTPGQGKSAEPPIVLGDPPPVQQHDAARLLIVVASVVAGLILCVSVLIFAIGFVLHREASRVEQARAEVPSSNYPGPIASEHDIEHDDRFEWRQARADGSVSNIAPMPDADPPGGMASGYPRTTVRTAISPAYRALQTGSAGDQAAPMPRPRVYNHGPDPYNPVGGGYGGMSGSAAVNTAPDGIISSGGAPVGHQPHSPKGSFGY